MMNLIYIIPKKEQLYYRKHLVEDIKTMEYNHGIVLFPEEKWDSWYEKWIGNNNPNFYYAYIFDKDIQSYVGEIAYRKEEDSNMVTLSVIIEYSYRNKGYGKEALKGLINIAFKNGYKEVYDIIDKDNINSQKMFSNFGFKIVGYDEMNNVIFKITKEEFIKKYGKIK